MALPTILSPAQDVPWNAKFPPPHLDELTTGTVPGLCNQPTHQLDDCLPYEVDMSDDAKLIPVISVI